MTGMDSISQKKGYEYFKHLVSNMPMIFYVLDLQGTFKLSDGLGLEKLGLKPGQVVGMSAFDLYAEYPDIIQALNRAYKGESVQYDHALGHLELENHVAPYFDADGNILGIVGATIDISSRKSVERQLKEANNMTEAILESVPGMIYLYNEEGHLAFWNKNHETMTGYSSDELKLMSLTDWFKNDTTSIESISIGLAATASGGVGFAEADLQCKDGSKIPMYFTAKGLVIDGSNYFIGMGIDMTAKRIAEKQLIELNETLEKKVEERTHELLKANEELTGANEELYALNEEVQAMNEELMYTNEKMRDMQGFLVESEKMAALGNMVAGISHEINTPVGVGVTAASSLVDMIHDLRTMKQHNQLTNEDFDSYLEDIEKTSTIILKNLNRASRLVQSFKQLSIDQSIEPRRRFNIKNYLEEILISLSPTIKKTKVVITYTCNSELEIDGYPGAFAQIITNLVLNSLSHGYAPDMMGKIHLEFSETKDDIKLVYSDDGLGMTDAVLSKIFDPFYTTKRGAGGSGLGLFVVYGLITKQFGGSIHCESVLEKGTYFYVSLAKGGH